MAEVGKLNVKLGLDDSAYKSGLSNAEGDARSAGSKMGGLLGSAGKMLGGAVVAGVAVAGTALAGLSVKSLNLYADYEQLVGGIDTLFKGSSEALQGYADEAFKTAGLSANNYMETVTGFAASLISSVGGDTAKATEYANQAVIDMADNANKMGTNMESIQLTYQSLARGNYGMLDNLKLGYGGTKEELERLLEEASKISGMEYDISNFADVTQAIHVIQEEMGIAGASAAEAADTISGSIGSLKSSFENLLTGLGDPNADIEKLVGNVVEAFGNVVKNITPIIENILAAMPAMVSGILSAIVEILPSIVETFAGLVPAVVDALMAIVPIISEFIPVIVETIVTALPALIEVAVEIIIALVEGLVEAIPILAEAIPSLIQAIIEAIIKLLPVIIESAINIVLALVDGLLMALPYLIEAVPTLISTIVETLITYLPEIMDAALQIILALVQALVENAPLLLSAIAEIAGILLNGIAELIPKMWDAGKNLIMGLWDGIKSIDLRGMISGLGDSIVQSFQSAFDMHSPSKRMEKEVWSNLLPSSNSIADGMKNVTAQIDGAVNNMFGGMNYAGAGGDAGGSMSVTIENINLSSGTPDEAKRAGDIIGNRVVSAVQKARSRGN